MNIKMTINPQLSTTESKKNKLSKQPEQEQNHRYRDQLEGHQLILGISGRGKGRIGEKVQGLRSTIVRYKT